MRKKWFLFAVIVSLLTMNYYISAFSDEEIASIGKPQNVMLSDTMILSWDELQNANDFIYCEGGIYSIDGKIITSFSKIYREWSTADGRSSIDISDLIEKSILEYGASGQSVKVRAQLSGHGTTTYNGEELNISGEFSESTDFVTYGGEHELQPDPFPEPEPEPSTTKNGLSFDDDGVWRYYENGTFVEKTGIVEFEGGKFFVGNGLLCSDANGLASYDDQWYFLANGQIQTQYTGLALYDGEWFYVQNGLFDPNLNGLVDYDGSKFIVAAGRIIRGVNGLWQNTDGVWYYLADSQVVTYYTGLTQYDGAWFYVINGRLATEFTGEVEYDGAVFNVVNGEVV